jgi:hypothetical protein
LTVALLAVALLPSPAAPEPPYWMIKGCQAPHRSSVAYRRIRTLLHHTNPAVDKPKVKLWATCLTTKAKAHEAHERARAHWKWRHQYAQRWTIRLNRMPAAWVQWARNITACESTWNRYASNGSHFSFYQFSAPTWAAASAGFDPPPSIYQASWAHQSVIAINWAWKAGTSQWVCQG